MTRHLTSFILLAACFSANAQSPSELNQKLGACSTQTEQTKRAICFENLAKEAVAAYERVAATSQLAVASANGMPQSKYADLIAKSKTNITRNLKDPSSVQWRNLYVSGKQGPALCGELNAKNSYGAYIGFRRFFATPEPMLQAIEDPKDLTVINGMWKTMCGEKVEDVES